MVFPFFALYGWVAEWSCSGLQIRVRRFNSDPSLHLFKCLWPIADPGPRVLPLITDITYLVAFYKKLPIVSLPAIRYKGTQGAGTIAPGTVAQQVNNKL